MEYLFLTQDEIDVELAAAIRSREMEYSNYELNKRNYENLLAKDDLSSDYRDQLKKLLNDTIREMKKVEGIHESLKLQLPQERREVAFMKIMNNNKS